MQEKPHLADQTIITCLENDYGLTATQIDFLPLGNDSSAWVYRVTTADGAYFLKVRQGKFSEPSLTVPRLLNDRGVSQVVAPLPTTQQTLWATTDDFHLILYPFIEGEMAAKVGLTDDHWREFGHILNRIHQTDLSTSALATLPKETFRPQPKWHGLVKRFDAHIDEAEYQTDFERDLAAFWLEKRREIRLILQRAESLGELMQMKQVDFVLCHADIHTWNILLNSQGQMFIIDWDETIIAPKERDLMFVVGGKVGGINVGDQAEILFFEGYGQAQVDQAAIAYYRYEWVVQEIADYGKRIFLMDELGDESKTYALQGFKSLFESGNVVEAAFAAKTMLPPAY